MLVRFFKILGHLGRGFFRFGAEFLLYVFLYIRGLKFYFSCMSGCRKVDLTVVYFCSKGPSSFKKTVVLLRIES